MNQEVIHATSVSLNGQAVVITGPSGSGKSLLALRLIMDKGGRLIADDMTVLKRAGDVVTASAFARPGQIEVRGIGILEGCVSRASAPVGVVLSLEGSGLERLPETQAYQSLLGVNVPKFSLDPDSVYLDVQAYAAIQVATGKMKLLNNQKEKR